MFHHMGWYKVPDLTVYTTNSVSITKVDLEEVDFKETL